MASSQYRAVWISNVLLFWAVDIAAVSPIAPAAEKDEAIARDRNGDVLPAGAIARLGRSMRFRHGSGVSSIAYTPDGKILISACNDIRLWDPASGQEIRRLAGHSGSVQSVAIASDGIMLASGGSDGMVRLWDVSTGRELRNMKGHTSLITAVAFSSVGNLLASTGHDRTVRLWEASSGKLLLTIAAHEDYAAAVAFSPDGKILATASSGHLGFNQEPKNADRSIRLWDPATGKRLQTLEGHKQGVHRIVFSPNGKLLASASWFEGTIRLWDVASGKEVNALLLRRPSEQ